MILWNALWKNDDGVTITNTIPIIRVLIRIILTGNSKGAFDEIYNDVGSGSEDGSEGRSESGSEEESGDSLGEVWVIRRKPSNPDYKNTGVIGGLSGIYTGFKGMFFNSKM
jgi:hypothetical protein